MDRFDRIYQLDSIIKNSRLPVSKFKLKNYLECSNSTIDRTIEDLRDHLGAPIIYDRKRNGYYYDDSADSRYELPGLWFNATELFALLASQQLLRDIQPGLLEGPIKPLTNRIKCLLSSAKLGHETLEQRVKLIPQTPRKVNKHRFQKIISAIATRKQIQCTYHARGTDEKTYRTLSPQRVVHYRDNWYLDAWCHKRADLRTFSIEKIIDCGLLSNDAIDIKPSTLDEYFTSAYGIFSGHADKIAVLEFAEKYAPWVADECWHPEQTGEWLSDGRYRLQIPYRHSQELVMDILKYGADVEVIEPIELRQKLIETIQKMQKNYKTRIPTSRNEVVSVGLLNVTSIRDS